MLRATREFFFQLPGRKGFKPPQASGLTMNPKITFTIHAARLGKKIP